MKIGIQQKVILLRNILQTMKYSFCQLYIQYFKNTNFFVHIPKHSHCSYLLKCVCVLNLKNTMKRIY